MLGATDNEFQDSYYALSNNYRVVIMTLLKSLYSILLEDRENTTNNISVKL